MSFQAERAEMKNSFGTRHCYAKKVDGQTHYYAVYGKDVVEINKEIFDVLDRSYSMRSKILMLIIQ